MHIPDGFVSGPVNIAGALVAVGALGLSVRRAAREAQQEPHTIPLLATTGAFVFAAQMVNFPIGVGTSGHFLGAAAVAALLGPCRACVVMSLVVTLQALAFNDGGLTALGTNIFNMAVVGGFGAYLIMRVMRLVLPAGRVGYLVAAATAAWASVVIASAACAVELAVSGTSPLYLVLPAMLGVHAVIGIGEALITSALLSAVIAARPDVVPGWSGINDVAAAGGGRRRAWNLAGLGLLAALVVGTFGSPLASSNPDGLEKVAAENAFADLGEAAQVWQSPPLPDYTVPGVEDASLSTGLAGLLGTSAMFAVGFCVVRLLGTRRAKRET